MFWLTGVDPCSYFVFFLTGSAAVRSSQLLSLSFSVDGLKEEKKGGGGAVLVVCVKKKKKFLERTEVSRL